MKVVILIILVVCCASIPSLEDAAVLSQAHQYEKAVEARSKLLEGAPISTFIAQATDLLNVGKPQAALQVIDAARSRGGLPEVMRILMRLEMKAMLCTGQASSAVAALRKYKQVTKSEAEQRIAGHADDPWLEMDILERVLYHEGPGLPPPAVKQVLRSKLGEVRRTLLTSPGAAWLTPLQLPRQMIKGLASKPWHSTDASVPGSYPALRPWEAILKSHTTELRQEFVRLHLQGILDEERECIHATAPQMSRSSFWSPVTSYMPVEASTGLTAGLDFNDTHLMSLVAPGRWKAFIADAAWTDKSKLDSSGCNTVDTPVACKVRAALMAVPGTPKVVRVSYSGLGPGAHLHPHYGQTNRYLKFHLGLTVPCGGASGARHADGRCVDDCVKMSVGADTARPWLEAGVSFFDDSYLHTVTNECDRPRVILQVLFEHPDLMKAG